jgi:hypothetical protein
MSQKVIACFGCSFTGGVFDSSEPRQSWPYQLSLARPDLKVYNFGKQATSVLFSLNMIDQVSEQLKSDLVITQLTEPTRMTFYDPGFKLNLEQDLLQISDNYSVLPMSIKGIWPFNGLSGKRQTKENLSNPATAEKFQFLKNLMVMHEDQNHFDPEYRAFSHRARSLSDLVFFHRKLYREVPGLENVPCVEKLLGTEKFLDLVIDKGFHFGIDGAQWISNWVVDKLKL